MIKSSQQQNLLEKTSSDCILIKSVTYFGVARLFDCLLLKGFAVISIVCTGTPYWDFLLGDNFSLVVNFIFFWPVFNKIERTIDTVGFSPKNTWFCKRLCSVLRRYICDVCDILQLYNQWGNETSFCESKQEENMIGEIWKPVLFECQYHALLVK